MDDDALQKLQERLGVTFKDSTRLRRALTHRSVATENSLNSNERLEFLGDSVLGLVISEALYRRFPQFSEGELAKSKSYIVSETALAQAAQQLGLEEFICVSAGEAAAGGNLRRSILADAFEAVLAAVYLDRGMRAARTLAQEALEAAVREAALEGQRRDYKSALQELTQARHRVAPLYTIIAAEGRDHEKTFTAEVSLGDETIGTGSGKSKKEAEQSAARDALEKGALEIYAPLA